MANKDMRGEVASKVIDKLYREFDYEFSEEVISKMIKDLDIACAINSIKRGICARELNIVSYNNEDERVGEVEARLNFDTLTSSIKHIIDSKFYGYSISEIVFDEEMNYRVKPKAHALFDFDKDSKRWFYKGDNNKVYLDENKFIVSVNNPHLAYKGESILYELYKDYQLKVDLDRNLGGLINRYGDRIIWYVYDPNMSEDDAREQMMGLKEARNGNVIGFPGGEGIELNKQFGFINLSDLKTEIHTQLLTRYEKKIDKYLLGNTLAQNEGSNGKGSYSQAKVHNEQQIQAITDYVSFVEEQLTKVLELDAMLYGYDAREYYIKLSERIDVDRELEREKSKKDIEEKDAQILLSRVDVLSRLSQSGYEIDEKEIRELTGLSSIRKSDTVEFSKKKGEK